MVKDLNKMSLEELWELFPIVLVPHKKVWAEWARCEIALLSELLTDFAPLLHHIGSTAIPEILAKPVIDILVELSSDIDRTCVKDKMESAGYICMSLSDKRMSFNKGYTCEGYAEKVFHIHFHASGDNDEVFFRDYLNSHPTEARAYEMIKIKLLSLYPKDRDKYTEGKTEFVNRIGLMRRHEV